MTQLINDLNDPFILNWIIALFFGCLTLIFYALIISPKQHEKSESRRATKEEIEHIINEIDPIDPAKIQEFCNN